MAIFHCQFQIISRSNGSSSVAAAAYRSGEKLVNLNTGEIHNYVKSAGDTVDTTFILAPHEAPAWAFDREQLWSAVEKSERRKNSQLARELNIALPIELDRTQQEALVRDYSQAEFVDRGMVADIAFHNLASGNPHAHVMLTQRRFDGDRFCATKERDWNKRELVPHWRESWANHTNKALLMAGHGHIKIDHRSNEDQGLDTQPTIHLGHKAAAMERKGIKTDRGNINRAIRAANDKLKEIQRELKGYAYQLADLILPRAPQFAAGVSFARRLDKVIPWENRRERLAELALTDAGRLPDPPKSEPEVDRSHQLELERHQAEIAERERLREIDEWEEQQALLTAERREKEAIAEKEKQREREKTGPSKPRGRRR